MSAEILSPIGSLPVGWKLEKLVNITTKIGSGSTPRGGDSAYLSERVEFAFVRSQNVLDFHFNESEIKYISNDDSKKLKGVHLQKNDILLNITGDGVTFGRSCIVPENILPAAVNQHVTIIRVNPELCLPGYLLAYLCLPIVKEYISSFNAGGSRRAITKAHIESFDIPIAPRHIQLYIEKITFDYLNKINLNTQTNQTLESIAQAIFKSWFVDFEPVKAKMATLAEGGTREQAELAAMGAISGKGEAELAQLQQQNPEHYQQLAETAALFPSAMVESELGEIPEGWEVKSISDFGRIICGKTPSKSEPQYFGQGIPFIKIPDMHSEIYVVSPTEELTLQGAESQKNKTIPTGSICVSCIATVGKVVITHRPSQTNQQINSIVPNAPESTIYLYFQMKCKEQEFHDLASGGSATLNMNTSTFSKVNVLKPSNDCLERFHLRVDSIFKKILAAQQESKELADLRDTLLPKLLSGEIDLSDIQSEVA